MTESLVQYTIRSTGQALKKHGHEVVTLLKGQMFYVLLLLWMSFAMLYYIEKVTKTPKWQLLELEQKYKTYLGLWLISLGQNFELSQQLLALQMEVEALRLRKPPPYPRPIPSGYDIYDPKKNVLVTPELKELAERLKDIKISDISAKILAVPYRILAGSKTNVVDNYNEFPLQIKDQQGNVIVTIPGKAPGKDYYRFQSKNQEIAPRLAGQTLHVFDNNGKDVQTIPVLPNKRPVVGLEIFASPTGKSRASAYVGKPLAQITVADDRVIDLVVDLPGSLNVAREGNRWIVIAPREIFESAGAWSQYTSTSPSKRLPGVTIRRAGAAVYMDVPYTISDGVNESESGTLRISLPSSY